MNLVVIKGHLTREPELKHTTSNVAVCDIGLAVNERFTNRAGETVEKTLFVDVTVWGKQAESLSKYMGKGAPVLVEGALQLEQWENERKEKRQKITIRANRVEFLHKAAGKPDPTDADAPAYTDGENIPF
jgi:single-strand DNA-binding protein